MGASVSAIENPVHTTCMCTTQRALYRCWSLHLSIYCASLVHCSLLSQTWLIHWTRSCPSSSHSNTVRAAKGTGFCEKLSIQASGIDSLQTFHSWCLFILQLRWISSVMGPDEVCFPDLQATLRHIKPHYRDFFFYGRRGWGGKITIKEWHWRLPNSWW